MRTSPRSQERLLPKLLTAAVSSLACLLVGEVVVRVLLSHRLDTSLLRERLEERSIKQLIQPSAEPELYYELRPNLRTTFAGKTVFTNERGCRVAENELESAGAPRSEGEAEPSVHVAILGDSTAFGWGVAYEDTYADQFRRRMRERTGASIEVWNYSVPGYNASQELAAFVKRAADDSPDLVLLHHDHNDSEATGQQYPPNYFPPAYGDNFLHSALLKLAMRETTALLNRATRLWKAEADEYYQGTVIGGPLYDGHLASRRQLADEAARLGVPALVIIFNADVKADSHWEERKEYQLLHKGLSEKLEHMGFYVLDLYPRYQEWLRRNGWSDMRPWWVRADDVDPDAHPNADGHAFIADALVDFVLEDPTLSAIFASSDSVR